MIHLKIAGFQQEKGDYGMTNLEAKEKLYNEWQKLLDYSLDYAGISEAYKMAFKALDQQSILDRIRAEVKGMTPTYHNLDWSITDLVPISKVLDVMDKYKEESEE